MSKWLKISVVVTSLSMIIINVLANVLPYNGISTAAVSDSFKVFFVPAGYVFAIWGVIYLGIIAYSIYQARTNNKALDTVATYVIIGNIANSIWIFTWHYLLIPFTLPLMLILLVSLVQTYIILRNSKDLNRWFTTVPFGIYLGWISVATIANVTDFLDYFGIKSFIFDGVTWSGILILIAGVFALTFVRLYKEITYPLVIVWAVIGIAVKFPNESFIGWTSLFTIVTVVFAILISIYYNNSKHKLKLTIS